MIPVTSVEMLEDGVDWTFTHCLLLVSRCHYQCFTNRRSCYGIGIRFLKKLNHVPLKIKVKENPVISPLERKEYRSLECKEDRRIMVWSFE